ncbi:MAG: hypothetical protein JWM44_1327 [Bacilli bacterium]|nr:hypothetical protein [Bacilli bacterium]
MDLDPIDAVRNTLKQDVEFMALLGLAPSSDPNLISSKLIAGMEPEKAVTGTTVPMVLIYEKPGRFGSNPLVFEGKFCLDFFGKNRDQLKSMFDRAFKLFHDKRIMDANFGSFLCVLAYDSDFMTGITGIKGYQSIFDVDYLRTN